MFIVAPVKNRSHDHVRPKEVTRSQTIETPHGSSKTPSGWMPPSTISQRTFSCPTPVYLLDIFSRAALACGLHRGLRSPVPTCNSRTADQARISPGKTAGPEPEGQIGLIPGVLFLASITLLYFPLPL